MSRFISILSASTITLLAGVAHAQTNDRMTAEYLVKVEPAPGVAAVGKFKPTWCAHLGDDQSPRAIARSTGTDDLWGQVDQAAVYACADPDDPIFQQQLGYYMQQWANLTGETPAQIGQFLALRADDERWRDQAAETCTKLAVTDEASPRQRVLAALAGDVLGCRGGSPGVPAAISLSSNLGAHWLWQLDRTPEPPSQLAAIGRILQCEGTDNPSDLFTLVQFAACKNELAYLDDKALAAELEAGGWNDEARAVAQLSLSTARLRAAALDKAVAARAAGDEDLTAILIDAPARGWKAWTADYTANRDAYDAAYAYEDKASSGRKSAAKGCLADAHRDLDAFLATLHGKTIDDLLTAATAPRGMTLLARAATCDRAESREGVANAYALAISYGVPGRGPRTAVHMAMQSALAEVLADRDRFAITADMMRVDLDGDAPLALADARGVHDRIAQAPGGTVAKVKTVGDRVFVTFKTAAWKEPEVSCVDTNRLAMIRPDGSPIYRQKCTATGKTLTRTDTPEPFWTWSSLAAGLAPGTFVSYTTSAGTGDTRQDGVFEGIPYAIWKTKDQKSLVAVLGIRTR